MRISKTVLTVGLAAGTMAAGGFGCSKKSEPQPVERVRIEERPPPVAQRQRPPEKPLPGRGPDSGPESQVPPPPFDDVPLITQRPPEQRAFVEAYESVGRPRIMVFVNRTLEGDIVPVDVPGADGDRSKRRDELGITRGEFDDADARALDYAAMENILTDWLAADGRVEIVSPVMARQRLTGEQVRDLQDAQPRAMGEVARQFDADVLVLLQARPTAQTRDGLQIRVVGEAINVGRGGQSIARAVVEVPPPLDKPQLNKYTRFLARKLMDGMAATWRAVGPDGRGVPARDGGAGPIEGGDRGDRPILDDRANPRREPPPADGEGLRPRDATQEGLIDDRAAPPTRPAPTTRPSAPPADEPPTDNK